MEIVHFCRLNLLSGGLVGTLILPHAMGSFGGTWLMHKYPGTRSESDLFIFGYGLKPWKGNPIASRPQILDFLGGPIENANLGPHIRYGHTVQSAD